MMEVFRALYDVLSDKALAVGIAPTPAASALPLTKTPPRELAKIDAELKGVTDRIVQMIGGLSK